MALFSCLVFLILYLPLFVILSSNFIMNIICLFVAIYFVNIIGFYILISKNYHLEVFSVILSILLYIIFICFTYFPIHNFLFYDYSMSKYGVDKYVLAK